MRLTSPSLTLQFLGTDLPSGHGGTQTITECYIVKGSISKRPQLLNGLKPSGSICSIAVSRDCLSTEDIIATDGDIKAVLSDGGNIIFTGYLSTKYSWTVGNHGEEALSLTLEDVGARLLGKNFLESGYHVFNGTASAAISAVCLACGITISPTAETITQTIFKVVDSSVSCKQIIEEILYECNRVYTFNNLGHMDFFEVDISSTTGQTIGSSKLIVRNGTAITLSKDVRTYRSARVTYTPLGTADNYLVYRNTTNQDNSHPYCYIELNPGEHFDGAEIYTAQEWAAATADTFRLPTLIGAVNADSETSKVGSNKILSISNVVATIDKDSAITATIVGYGGPYLKIDCENTGNSKAYIRRLDAYASIVYERSTNIVNAGVNDTSTQSRLEETLSCIHDLDAVSRHANLLAQFNAYCNSKYTFSSKEVLDLGEIVKLNDDVYTGLDVSVMVIAYTDTDNMDTIDYTAIGVSVFDLDKESYHQVTEMGKADTKGRDGLSVFIEYALGKDPDNPPLSGPMYWDGEQMLWEGEPMYWDDTEWTSTVPIVTRGHYLWMRTKVGIDGEWHYSRVSAEYVSEVQFLGAVTTLPTMTLDGLPLIPGDYFVASEEFSDGTYTYRKGYVYEYRGPLWAIADLSNPKNLQKGIESLSAILEDGTMVDDSHAAIYGWFKNLVAQNAVFQNLYARNVQVGDGDGTEGSGFRFRAMEYDRFGQKLSQPHFDVYFGDKMLFDVDADGKIYFGTGFWYDPSDETIHSFNDNVLINSEGLISAQNAIISGISSFHGVFDCDVIKTVQQNPTQTPYPSTVNGTQQCRLLVTSIISGGLVPFPLAPSSDTSAYFRAKLSVASSVYYCRFMYRSWTGQSEISFYDVNLNKLDIRNIVSCTVTGGVNSRDVLFTSSTTGSAGQYATNGITIIVITGGNVLQVDIPNSDYTAGLSSGQLYFDKNTGAVMMKL